MKQKSSSGDLPGKPVRDSKVQMTEIVLPIHTNAIGTIFGGQIMAWIDIAAAISASRHARRVCVTASIDALHFIAPVRLGEYVALYASVNYTNRTSMEVGVRVESEDPRTGKRTLVAVAYLTFVALDDKGSPTPVPPVTPETDEEKQRFRDAQTRRQARLRLKQELDGKRTAT